MEQYVYSQCQEHTVQLIALLINVYVLCSFLHVPCYNLKDSDFRDWLLTKLLNAEFKCHQAPDFRRLAVSMHADLHVQTLVHKKKALMFASFRCTFLVHLKQVLEPKRYVCAVNNLFWHQCSLATTTYIIIQPTHCHPHSSPSLLSQTRTRSQLFANLVDELTHTSEELDVMSSHNDKRRVRYMAIITVLAHEGSNNGLHVYCTQLSKHYSNMSCRIIIMSEGKLDCNNIQSSTVLKYMCLLYYVCNLVHVCWFLNECICCLY